jgi:hypothetical protein
MAASGQHLKKARRLGLTASPLDERQQWGIFTHTQDCQSSAALKLSSVGAMSASPADLKCKPISLRNGSKMTLLHKCTIAVGVLILPPPSSALASCVAHCLLIQRGMEANLQGAPVAEWSQSSGVFRLDLGTVEAPLNNIDSECEQAKQNFLENPSISENERVGRYVWLHTMGINEHVDLVPASSWTVDKAKPWLIVKIEPPSCK